MDTRSSSLGAALAATHGSANAAMRWLSCCGERLAIHVRDSHAAVAPVVLDRSRKAREWISGCCERLGSSLREARRASGPIAREASRTALRWLAWCGQRCRIYARAWRNTMAAMSAYEDMMRQSGAGKVQPDATRKVLGALTRDC